MKNKLFFVLSYWDLGYVSEQLAYADEHPLYQDGPNVAGSTWDLNRPLDGMDSEVNDEDQKLDEANEDVSAEINLEGEWCSGQETFSFNWDIKVNYSNRKKYVNYSWMCTFVHGDL